MPDGFLLYGLGISIGGICGLINLLDCKNALTLRNIIASVAYSMLNALTAIAFIHYICVGNVHIAIFGCVIVSLGGEHLAKLMPQVFYNFVKQKLEVLDNPRLDKDLQENDKDDSNGA